MSGQRMNELAFYTLAGQPKSPTEMFDELAAGERLGLGSAFISERLNVKEAATLAGAAAACTRQLGLATGATNAGTRQPTVLAAHATTMHRLTGGRYALGIGRGIAPVLGGMGLAPSTTAELEDFAGIMHRLWRGEVIVDHDGPAGHYPKMVLDPTFDEAIPLMITAFGPETLALAGRAFDGVILHTFFADETLARCVATVRSAAEKAGRDPASVRVWSVFATIGDHVPEDLRLKKTVGRLATYLQLYGDLLVATNHWDPAVLARFRADPLVASFPGWFDVRATTEELEHVATLIPDEWLAPAATGTPEQCAAKILGQLDLGADSVILHGAGPAELEPILPAYRALRPAGRFDALPANPGAT